MPLPIQLARSHWSLALVAALIVVPSAHAEDVNEPGAAALRAAIARAIPLLEKGAAGSAAERTCFTCHNQAVPVFALVETRRRGFAIDSAALDKQLAHTAAHLATARTDYLEGRGQGGKVLAAGYALWTLEAGGRPADEVTAAVAQFILGYQANANRWSHPGSRPPSAGSDFTATYVALRGLSHYGSPEQQAEIDRRKETIRQWLLAESPTDTEERVFRLLALPYVAADKELIEQAAFALRGSQRADGGWGQTPEMSSDPYATATAIFALTEGAGAPVDGPAIRRGLAYLVRTQLDDGSWHIVSRAKPFQTYYESGYPHGKDQFISIAAAGWATVALARSLPEVKPGASP